MRPTFPLLLLGALSCSNPQALTTSTSAASDTYRSYRTWDAATAHSTVLDHQEPTQRTLRGHTQLKDGSWLMEQATLDARGRLIRAEIDRGGPCDEHPTHIAIDAQRGTVELSSASLYKRWSVPTDLPWVPVGLLPEQHIHTPVAMTIAHKSAQSARAARLVDVEHFTSATIMSDQLLVRDIEQTVVLGDDYAEMDGDLPARVHLAAFDHDLDAHDPDLSAAWAKLRCQDPQEGTAL
jgi:hypothetical protein